jgi:mercuric ion transport protein
MVSAAARSAGEATRGGLLAVGSLLGAGLAASCCILPLALLTLGVSGAWITGLTALAPYQPVFLLATGGLLAAGFWTAYRRPHTACAPGSACAAPRRDRTMKVALWFAAALVTAALGADLLAAALLREAVP